LQQLLRLAGAPIEQFPQGKWDYIAHQAVNQGQSIVLWAWMAKYADTRLYKFPYNRETMKKLNKAGKNKQKGMKMRGRFERPRGQKVPTLYTEQGTVKSTDTVKVQ
jgi:hypothetical protein